MTEYRKQSTKMRKIEKVAILSLTLKKVFSIITFALLVTY